MRVYKLSKVFCDECGRYKAETFSIHGKYIACMFLCATCLKKFAHNIMKALEAK